MPLKIILLLDSFTLQAWQFEVIRSMMKGGHAQLIACVINQSPKTSGTPSPFIYRLYRWLDRKLFVKEPDAFADKDFNELGLGNLILIPVNPTQSKYSDRFPKESIAKIKVLKPDLIIRFGFRILAGEILTLPRLGVWSYHHGDPTQYRGGPPAFWEVMLEWKTTGTVLQRLTEDLDQGIILYHSWSHTDPLSVQRNATTVFWKSSYFVSRVLNQLAQKGEEKWLEDLEKENSIAPTKSQLKRPPANLHACGLVGQLLFRNLTRKIQEKRKQAHWEIALVNHQNPEEISPSDIQLIKRTEQTNSYLADPFPVFHKGETYVFAEEYDSNSKKGSIVCGKLVGDQLLDLQTVVCEDYHVSYPFVFELKDEFYMIPESADAGQLLLYKATTFPFLWEKKNVFFEGEAYDPTLFQKDGKYWLFINQKPHPACSSFDELYLYSADSMDTPTWKPHPMNPIVSDVRRARPAGKLFEKDGKLFRPAQDSGKRYGHRIAVQEVLELSESCYQEQTAYVIEPKLVDGALGVHTLNFSKDRMFLDFYFRK